MASRKQIDEPRNDAEAVFDRLFGDTEGWEERVAAATSSILLAEQIYALRERHGLSQRDLAKLIDSSQSAIARMEDAKYTGHSISVLSRIAAAVGEQVVVQFIAPPDTGARYRAISKRSARTAKPTALMAGSKTRGKKATPRGYSSPRGKKVTA